MLEVTLCCLFLPLFSFFSFMYIARLNTEMKNVNETAMHATFFNKIDLLSQSLKDSIVIIPPQSSDVVFSSITNSQKHFIEEWINFTEVSLQDDKLVLKKKIKKPNGKILSAKELIICENVKEFNIEYIYENSENWESECRKDIRDTIVMIKFSVVDNNNTILCTRFIDCFLYKLAPGISAVYERKKC